MTDSPYPAQSRSDARRRALLELKKFLNFRLQSSVVELKICQGVWKIKFLYEPLIKRVELLSNKTQDADGFDYCQRSTGMLGQQHAERLSSMIN